MLDERFPGPGLDRGVPIDVTAFHTYAVDWRPDSLLFTVDGQVTKKVDQAPDHPVQLELAVFDFRTTPSWCPTRCRPRSWS
jgi:beta-glucanase (GH16 family)